MEFAARMYGSTKSSVQRRVEAGTAKLELGRPSYMTDGDREELGDALSVLSETDHALRRQHLKPLVSGLLLRRGYEFSEKGISDTFVRELEKQLCTSGDITMTRAIPTSTTRTLATHDTMELRKYLEEVRALYDEYPILKTEPRRWANVDETPDTASGEKRCNSSKENCAYTRPSRLKEHHSLEAVRTDAPGDGRGNITVLPMILGDGSLLDVAFIVTGVKFQMKWIRGPYLPGFSEAKWEDVVFAVTEHGFVTTEVFAEICMIFFERWRAMIPDGPLVYVMDMCNQHAVKEALAKAAVKDNITVLGLPHNTSCATQPLDNGPNKFMKDAIRAYSTNLSTVLTFKQAYLTPELMIRFCDPGMEPLPRSEALLGLDDKLTVRTRVFLAYYALENAVSKECVRAGWRRVGLLPYDPTRLLPVLNEAAAAASEAFEKMTPEERLRQDLQAMQEVASDLTWTQAQRWHAIRKIVERRSLRSMLEPRNPAAAKEHDNAGPPAPTATAEAFDDGDNNGGGNDSDGDNNGGGGGRTDNAAAATRRCRAGLRAACGQHEQRCGAIANSDNSNDIRNNP